MGPLQLKCLRQAEKNARLSTRYNVASRLFYRENMAECMDSFVQTSTERNIRSVLLTNIKNAIK